ncbi:hypothetical protein FB567DRAFT_589450 [Paraphoma chrysanthemicola]|uniref:Uncharacterized protein n=1 Tax=Paraphoma chrysanthemicola TaxID=798071 RepID=A0A8K0RCV4_9PLEO|nr:hypothetical protein FB567DRAFT_589450 [Paraphoma chrysanthemicola]
MACGWFVLNKAIRSPVHISKEMGHALLGSWQYSDFTVTYKYSIWKLHKAMIASRSEFYPKVVGSPFKELKENKADLPNKGLVFVDSMLQGIHDLQHESPPKRPGQTDNRDCPKLVDVAGKDDHYAKRPSKGVRVNQEHNH